MIVKLKSWKKPQFRKLLEYMIHKKDRLTGTDGRGFLLLHNLTGRTIDSWVDQLATIESRRKHKRKDRLYCTHETLSFHPDDSKNITAEKLQDMTQEYIRLRGFKGSAVAVPHYDKEHFHVHILVSGTDLTGKAMRLSRDELATLKKNIQQYQVERFPELVHSVVRHGRKEKAITSDREYQLKARTGKMTKREQVAAMVSECHAQSISQDDFYARLDACKLPTYVRGGRIYGVVFEGRRYRFGTIGINVSISKERKRGLNQLRNQSGYQRE